MKKCSSCDIAYQGGMSNCIPGRWLSKYKNKPVLMVIGEAPDRDADKEGVPFFGDVGDVLTCILHDTKLSKHFSVYLTNVVRCRPLVWNETPTGGRYPSNGKPVITSQARVCTELYLPKELAIAKPDVIMVCGAVPQQTLLGVAKIWDNVGKVFELDEIANFVPLVHSVAKEVCPAVKIISNIHPSNVIRNPKEEHFLVDVISRVCDKAYGLLSGKSVELPKYNVVDYYDIQPTIFNAVSLDIEATSADPFASNFSLVCATVAINEYEVVRFKLPEEMDDLFALLSRSKAVIWHNGGYDAVGLFLNANTKQRQILFDLKWIDTMLLQSLSATGYKKLKLEHLALVHLGIITSWKNAEDYEALASGNLTEGMWHINSLDAIITYRLMKTKKLMQAYNNHKVYRDICDTTTKAYMLSRLCGIPLDKKEIARQQREVTERIAKVYGYLVRRVGNPNSRLQVLAYLRKLLPERFINILPKTEKKSVSLAQDAVETISLLCKRNPELGDKALTFVSRFAAWKKDTKLKGTYLDNFEKYAPLWHPDVYLTSNQEGSHGGVGGTVTGRATYELIQTTPRKGDIKKCVVSADPKGTLIILDYKQVELYCSAHIVGCQRMLKAISKGKDLHAITARKIFDVAYNIKDDEQRQIGKRTNFATIFYVTPFGLVSQLKALHGIVRSQEDGSFYIDSFFDLYREYPGYFLDIKKQVETKGYVITLTGRKIFTRDLRRGINGPTQSFAADIKRIAFELLMLKYRKEVGIPLFDIYDSIVIDIGNRPVEKTARLIKTIAEEEVFRKLNKRYGCGLKFPPRIDIKYGHTWAGEKGELCVNSKA